MKKFFKRSLAAMLALIMSVSMLNLTAFAGNAKNGCGIHSNCDCGDHLVQLHGSHLQLAYCSQCGCLWQHRGNGQTEGNGGAEWKFYGTCQHQDPNTGTSWLTETETTTPTCTRDGIKTISCTHCDYKTTETIPAKGHQWSGTADNCTTHTDAGCTGHSQTCNATWHDESVDGNKTVTEQHTFGNWVFVKHTDWGPYQTEELNGTQVSVRYREAIVKQTCTACEHYKTANVKYTDTDLKGVDKDKLIEVEGAKNFTVYHYEKDSTNEVAKEDKATFLKTDTSEKTFGVKNVTGFTPVNASASYTVNYNADESVSRIIYYTRNNYTLTINYVDEESKVLATQHTATLAFEASYSVPSADVDGYHLKDGSQATVSGKMPAGNVVVDVIYVKDPVVPVPATYTVKWVDQASGEEIKTAETRNGNVGDTVSVTDTDKVIEGYTYVSTGSTESTELAESNTELILYFTRDQVPGEPKPVTRVAVDENGTVIVPQAPTGDQIDEDGDPVPVTVPDLPAGYELIPEEPDTKNATYDNPDVIFTVRAIDYTLTVIHSYRNAAGVEVYNQRVDDEIKYHIRDSYSTTSVARDGYQFARTEGDAVRGTFGAGNITVTYIYNAVTVPQPPQPSEPQPTPPQTTPTPSPQPSEEVEVTDPPTPLDPTPELPEEPIEVDEPDTPLVNLPELPEEPVEVEVEDPDVPLANVPQTGDNTVLWATTAVVSGAGLIWLAVGGKKKEQED